MNSKPPPEPPRPWGPEPRPPPPIVCDKCGTEYQLPGPCPRCGGK